MESAELRKKHSKILSKTYPAVGQGWFWLLDHLCFCLQWDTDHNKAPQIEASTVKEKFGGLRFYYGSPDTYQNNKPTLKRRLYNWLYSLLRRYFTEEWRHDMMYWQQGGAIAFAELLSNSICEDCGSTRGVNQNISGWIRTLCPKCRKAKKNA